MSEIDFIDKLPGGTVTAVCAAWGAVLSTVHALCSLVRFLRKRPKIAVFAGLGFDGINQFLSLCVTNRRGQGVTVQSWGVDVGKGSGPVVLEVTGLPTEIPPYYYIHIRNDLSLFSQHQVTGIYVVTHGTKKWRVPKTNLQKLLADIELKRQRQVKSSGAT